MTADTLSPEAIAERFQERQKKGESRLSLYRKLEDAYRPGGPNGDGNTQANYADGRPALRDLDEFHRGLRGRDGAPNPLRPIVDSAVDLCAPLPNITFDDEDRDLARKCAMAVRGQYEISQMAVHQARAVNFLKKRGDVCYTLDPRRPSDVKKGGDPFAIPGVIINVHDPMHCYPRFGTGDQFNRVQELMVAYRASREEIGDVYGAQYARRLRSEKGATIVIHYTKQSKVTIVFQDKTSFEVHRDDHGYGFCPAEWAINRIGFDQYGFSEIDDLDGLAKNEQALYHLAMDSAILATFPPINVHEPTQAQRMKYGPLAIIETRGQGRINPIISNIQPEVAIKLRELSESSLMKQAGVSALRMEGDIKHANTSGRAIQGVQGATEAKMALANTLLGSTLEWVNAKIAMILYTDKQFKTTEMSVYTVVESRKQQMSFKGEDLGGLWRNHVRWPTLLSGSQHEEMQIFLQLQEKGIVPKRKVLEAIGEDDPESLLAEVEAEQAKEMQRQMAAQGPPPGAAPPGAGAPPAAGPPGAPPGPDMGAPGGAPGAVQPPPGPVQLPPHPPLAAPPGAAAQPPQSPDIWTEIQTAITGQPWADEIVGAYGSPDGIVVEVRDDRYTAAIVTALRPVAELVHGPGAKVKVKRAEKGRAA